MGHVALYRQFRPLTFDEVVEQNHAVTALRQAVISGQIAHAYLFCGTRGTGKTSIAKIFSRAINCLQPENGSPCNRCDICKGILDNTLMDVIEMDAASNNSVDNIRRICDEVMFLPSRARYKVYIVDEVHMLSSGAFNALLKTLEEPPSHAVFILATTEPHRIPATIISRCQRYDFRRIPQESIIKRLEVVAKAQNIKIDHEALATIATLSDGALRDAISLLDQVSATPTSGCVQRDDVLRMTGIVNDDFLYQMAEALLEQDKLQIITLTNQLIMDGRDIIRFTLDMAHYFRDLMVLKLSEKPGELIHQTDESLKKMLPLAAATPLETLVYVVARLSTLINELKWSPDLRTSFEIAFLGFFSQKDSQPPIAPRPLIQKDQGTAKKAQSSEVSNTAFDLPLEAKPSTASVSAFPPIENPPEALPIAVIDPIETKLPPLDMTPPVEEIEVVSNEDSLSSEAITEPLESVSIPDSSPIDMPAPSIPPLEEAISEDWIPPSEEDIPPPAELFSAQEPEVIEESAAPEEGTLPSLPPIPDIPDIPASFLQSMQSESPIATEISQDNLPVKEAPPATVVASPRLPLSELWSTLLHNWEDTIFSDVLQLRRASISQEDSTLTLLFPSALQAYAESLTQREDYKKIVKDIQMMIDGIKQVEVQIEASSQAQADSVSSAAAEPEWISQMRAFAEATGIPVETLEDS